MDYPVVGSFSALCPRSVERGRNEMRAPIRNRPPELSDLANLNSVAASAVQISRSTRERTGILVELKRFVAKEAADNGQVVEDSNLSDQAIVDRLDHDLAFRSVETRLLQRYGYLLPATNPDSSLGKEEEFVLKERARRLVQIQAPKDSESLIPERDSQKQEMGRADFCGSQHQDGSTGFMKLASVPKGPGSPNHIERPPTVSIQDDTNGYKPSVIAAALVLLILTAAARMTGFLRELLAAFFLGANAHTDSYVFAFMFYDWATTVGLAVTVAAMPLLTSTPQEHRRGSYRTYSVAILVVSVPLVFMLRALADPFSRYFAGKASDPEELKQFMRLMSWCFLLVAYGSLQSALLQSYKRFTLQGLGGAVVNLVCILLLTLWHRSLGAYSLVVGIVAGLLLQVSIQGLGIKLGGWPSNRQIALREELRVGTTFLRRFAGIAGSQLLFKGMPLVDRFLVLGLGVGLLSCLSYASRLVQLPLGLVGIAVSTAVLPYQVQFLRESPADYHALTDKVLRVMFLVSLFMTTLLFALAGPIVQVAYRRGAFSASDVALTTQAVISYAGSLIPLAVGLVLTNVLYCVTRTRLYVLVALLSLTGYAVLASFFVYWLGFTGIGWANTLVGWLYVLGVGTYLKARGYLNLAHGAASLAPKAIVCSLAAGATMAVCSNFMSHIGKPQQPLSQLMYRLMLPAWAGCAVFYFAGVFLFRIAEFSLLTQDVPSACRNWLKSKVQPTNVTLAREVVVEP